MRTVAKLAVASRSLGSHFLFSGLDSTASRNLRRVYRNSVHQEEHVSAEAQTTIFRSDDGHEHSRCLEWQLVPLSNPATAT